MDDKANVNPIEPNADASVDAAGGGRGQDIGVYLLDATTPVERTEFEQIAATAPEVRAEAVQLTPVVVALGRIYDLNPEHAPEAFAAGAEASPELKARVLASAAAADGAGPSAAPAPSAAPQPIRPQGRVRGGAPARHVEPTPIRSREWRAAWLATAALLIVAVGVTLWALGLQNKYDDQSREMHAQSTEIAQIRTSQNASAFTLTATGDGPQNAGGTLFYSPTNQQAVLLLNNMPAVNDNSVYQLWYIKGNNPAPGATFKPNADGSLVLKTNATISGFDVVALTEEPAGGSTTPTMPVLLAAAVGAAAG